MIIILLLEKLNNKLELCLQKRVKMLQYGCKQNIYEEGYDG